MRRSSAPSRGFTLVELMVAVVIIAILAGLAVASFSGTVDTAKITDMKRYAKEVEKGQHQYSSRNNRFLKPSSAVYSSGDAEWEKLLEFHPDGLHPDVRVMTTAGTPDSTNCNICPSSISPDTSTNWYAVKVCRDLDKSGTGSSSGGSNTSCDSETTVYLDNNREDPVILREGQ